MAVPLMGAGVVWHQAAEVLLLQHQQAAERQLREPYPPVSKRQEAVQLLFGVPMEPPAAVIMPITGQQRDQQHAPAAL
jgi:hypothetical protein